MAPLSARVRRVYSAKVGARVRVEVCDAQRLPGGAGQRAAWTARLAACACNHARRRLKPSTPSPWRRSARGSLTATTAARVPARITGHRSSVLKSRHRHVARKSGQ